MQGDHVLLVRLQPGPQYLVPKEENGSLPPEDDDLPPPHLEQELHSLADSQEDKKSNHLDISEG